MLLSRRCKSSHKIRELIGVIFARKHNVPGKNGEQIMKTIAEECCVDVSQFSGGGKEWTRVRKHKLPGQELLSLPIRLVSVSNKT